MAKAWRRDLLLCMRRTLKTVPVGNGPRSNTEFTSLMNFNDCRLAYRSKSTRELLRSLLVLGFCKREFLVDHSEKLIKTGKRVLGGTLFNKLMKSSFFGQFVAGENEQEIKPFIQRIRNNFGVNVILNYAVEDDEQGGEQEKSGLIKHGTTKSTRQDRREQTMYSFMKTVDQVQKTTACDGFAAIKVTALAKPETLIAVTDMVEKWESTTEPDFPGDVGENILAKLSGHEIGVRGWPDSGVQDLIRRMETIAKHAYERNVRVLVDAEQTYFQPAIARLSLELMRRYNLEKPTVYNTYQCYLKRTLKDMTAHLSLSKKENFHFGGKIVRGAYIVLERERASSMGYPDPINPTFEATTAMYKSVVRAMLEDMKAREGKTHIVIAGHNEETVQWAVSEVRRLQLPIKSRQIYFGQLLGMCDHLSFTLADAGFNVVKCVPYGSVDEVLPYLVRRAQENRGFLEKTDKERRLMWEEFRRRLKSGELMSNHDTAQPAGV